MDKKVSSGRQLQSQPTPNVKGPLSVRGSTEGRSHVFKLSSAEICVVVGEHFGALFRVFQYFSCH